MISLKPHSMQDQRLSILSIDVAILVGGGGVDEVDEP